MGEGLGNSPERKQQLKKIIKSIDEGSDLGQVKKEFDRLLRNISPEEIASIEQALIDEGLPVEQVQRLCDVHVAVFDEALKKHGRSKTLPGHPIHSYRQENQEAKKRMKTLKRALGPALRGRVEEFRQSLADLRLMELHYVRKENQLFPYLETVGFTGPSKVMWGKHDEIRGQFRELEAALDRGDAAQVKRGTKKLLTSMGNMIFMEEKILFPTSLRKLPEKAWAQIRKGEAAIGYAWISGANLWDSNIVGGGSSSNSVPSPGPAHHNPVPAAVSLDTGSLSREQINLLLKNLPLDVTFVDENDRVAYYSEGKERIFPRSPGIIGREVANCHPPKSVATVQRIVEALKKGEKSEAEFWLQMNGKFIHIRYYALFDGGGTYKGIIEVSQEVSGIRALEGERRLLDW